MLTSDSEVETNPLESLWVIVMEVISCIFIVLSWNPPESFLSVFILLTQRTKKNWNRIEINYYLSLRRNNVRTGSDEIHRLSVTEVVQNIPIHLAPYIQIGFIRTIERISQCCEVPPEFKGFTIHQTASCIMSQYDDRLTTYSTNIIRILTFHTPQLSIFIGAHWL